MADGWFDPSLDGRVRMRKEKRRGVTPCGGVKIWGFGSSGVTNSVVKRLSDTHFNDLPD